LIYRNTRLGSTCAITETRLIASAFNIITEEVYSMAESKLHCTTKPGWFMKALICFTAAIGAVGKASTVHESTPVIQNKTVLLNGVTIYSGLQAVETFTAVVNEFPEV